MRRRKVQEQQSEERQSLKDGNRTEVPIPRSKLIAVASRNGRYDDGNVYREVGNDNSNMSPFVREKFGKSKCGHLTIGSSEARDCEAGDDLVIRFG